MESTTLLVVAAFLGLIPGLIAHSKNRSFVIWWFFGAALFIVALPASLIVGKGDPDETKFKRCTGCREWIDRFATRCNRCTQPQASRS